MFCHPVFLSTAIIIHCNSKIPIEKFLRVYKKSVGML